MRKEAAKGGRECRARSVVCTFADLCLDVDLRDIARTSAAVHASPTNKDVTSITNAADVSIFLLFANGTPLRDNDMKADPRPQTGAKV